MTTSNETSAPEPRPGQRATFTAMDETQLRKAADVMLLQALQHAGLSAPGDLEIDTSPQTVDPEVVKSWARSQLGGLQEWQECLIDACFSTPGAIHIETRPKIVNTDTNGGKYEVKTQYRYVTEWKEE